MALDRFALKNVITFRELAAKLDKHVKTIEIWADQGRYAKSGPYKGKLVRLECTVQGVNERITTQQWLNEFLDHFERRDS